MVKSRTMIREQKVHRTRKVMVGRVPMGGGSPVTVQSMTTVPTTDVEAVLEQIHDLAVGGAELVRVAVPDGASARALKEIVERSPVPVISDIHFDPELAMTALGAGTHKLRLNPGNIRDPKAVRAIAREAGRRGVPIRIGVNSGSVPGDLREKYGGVNEDSMWAAAERHIRLLEASDFSDIVLSLKASDPMLTVRANRKAAACSDYPLHLGVTEAGPGITGGVRSAVALSILLNEGIGDTIRVSLSGSPVMEPAVGWEILSSLGIRSRFPRIVSCPTCARARIDVGTVARKVQEALRGVEGSVTVAVMGCEVNGPGEAREADIALIGTPSGMVLFIDGRMSREVDGTNLSGQLSGAVKEYIQRSMDRSGGTT